MKSNILTGWGIPAAIALALLAAGLAWGASMTHNPGARQGSIVVAVVLCAGAIALVIWTAAARVARDRERRRLQKYACKRCGYTPEPEQLEKQASFPCPTCGQTMYTE